MYIGIFFIECLTVHVLLPGPLVHPGDQLPAVVISTSQTLRGGHLSLCNIGCHLQALVIGVTVSLALDAAGAKHSPTIAHVFTSHQERVIIYNLASL